MVEKDSAADDGAGSVKYETNLRKLGQGNRPQFFSSFATKERRLRHRD